MKTKFLRFCGAIASAISLIAVPASDASAESAAFVSGEIAAEYETGAEIAPVVLSVGGQAPLTVRASGLPSGLKFTAKALSVKATRTTPAREYEANTIYGIPTRSGIYNATVSVTAADKSKASEVFKFVIRREGEKVIDLVAGTEGCKVSGAGVYLPGKKVSLKATAARGYVFAGWYSDESYSQPIDGSADFRTASYPYVVEDSDATFYAKFIPTTNDWATVDATAEAEYATGSEIIPIAVAADGGSLPTAKVAGLPSGLKFTAKELVIKGRNGTVEREYAANTIYGTPTKSGIYNATVTVTTAGKAKAEKTLKFIVRKDGEIVLDAVASAPGCKTAGAGVYAAGKKVSLRATAARGYVFAGWYADSGFSVPAETPVDFRTASMSYIAPESDTTLYAKFVESSEDGSIVIDTADSYAYSDAVDLKIGVESTSLPKVTVSTLPAGLKFDASTLTIKKGSATVPKPGTYPVTVKATNATVKKAVTKTFSIVVDNFTDANGLFVGGIANGPGEKYVATVGVEGGDLPSLELLDETMKLKVSGLPSGMTYNASEKRIAGAPSKAGTFTVTLTVGTAVSTFTLVVEPLPTWLVGDFGFELDLTDESGATNRVTWQDRTVTSAGKVSGRGRCFALAKSGDWTDAWLGSWTGRIVSRSGEGNSLKFVIRREVVAKSGDATVTYVLNLEVKPEVLNDATVASISGALEPIDHGITGGDGDGIGAAVSNGGANVWTKAAGTSVAPAFESGLAMNLDITAPQARVWDANVSFEYEGTLHLAFGKSGSVTYYYVSPEDGSVSGTGTATPVLSSQTGGSGGGGGIIGGGDAPKPAGNVWHFPVVCAPKERTPFVAIVEMKASAEEKTLSAETVELSVLKICARERDPYCGWAAGTFYGYHLLRNFDNGGASGYHRVVKIALPKSGGLTMYEVGLAGTERITQYYMTTNTVEADGARMEFNASFSTTKNSYGNSSATISRIWETLSNVVERAELDGLAVGVLEGDGRGQLEGSHTFDSHICLVKSPWLDDRADGIVLGFADTNTSVSCELNLNEGGLDVGYTSVTAALNIASNGVVDVRFTPAGDATLPGELYVDAGNGTRRRVQPLKYCSSRLVPYEFDGSVLKAFVTVSGAIKGRSGVPREEHGAFFSAVVNLEIPVDGEGRADIPGATCSLLEAPVVYPVYVTQ